MSARIKFPAKYEDLGKLSSVKFSIGAIQFEISADDYNATRIAEDEYKLFIGKLIKQDLKLDGFQGYGKRVSKHLPGLNLKQLREEIQRITNHLKTSPSKVELDPMPDGSFVKLNAEWNLDDIIVQLTSYPDECKIKPGTGTVTTGVKAEIHPECKAIAEELEETVPMEE